MDEKWYYTVKTRRRAKVLQRGKAGSSKKCAKALRVQHKGYIPKVMFLACTARGGIGADKTGAPRRTRAVAVSRNPT